tara:strand:+ start:440 stop:1087 length:648 start_codon:yes stop_codon:yes gene_type:complete
MTHFRQPINYTLVTGSNELAVNLVNVKSWLKIPSSLVADDTLLTALIKASAGYFEKITGRDLITKTYKTHLDRFPFANDIEYYSGLSNLNPKYNDNGIYLRKSKLQSITSIKYYVSKVLTTWVSSDYYISDEPDYSAIYLVEDIDFPSTIDKRKQAVEIIFTAGYGIDSTFVPEDVQQALLQLISYLYENRGDCSDSSTMSAAMDLFSQFKIVDF